MLHEKSHKHYSMSNCYLEVGVKVRVRVWVSVHAHVAMHMYTDYSACASHVEYLYSFRNRLTMFNMITFVMGVSMWNSDCHNC